MPGAAPFPRETSQGGRPPALPMRGHPLLIRTIHPVHLLLVGVVGHAIEQVDKAIGIQIQGCRLLPELLGADLVGPLKLGLGQLAGEEEQQLTFLLGREIQSGSLHRMSSRSRRPLSVWASSRPEHGFPDPSAMKRSGCYIMSPGAARVSWLPTPPGDLPW